MSSKRGWFLTELRLVIDVIRVEAIQIISLCS
jgi:hypothetical protein